MKEQVEKILANLTERIEKKRKTKEDLTNENLGLYYQQAKSANICVNSLIPDIKPGTIRYLMSEFPDFKIPATKKWLKVILNPGVILEDLRISFLRYLYENPRIIPEPWKQAVSPLIQSIKDNDLIIERLNAAGKDLEVKKKVIEKLLSADFEKMNAQAKEMLLVAINSVSKDIRKLEAIDIPKRKVQFPSPEIKHQNIVDELLAMYLLYELTHAEWGQSSMPIIDNQFLST